MAKKMPRAEWTPNVTDLGPPSGKPVHALKAIDPVPCAGCGQTIPAGELFTVHKRAKNAEPLPAKHYLIPDKPYCKQCWPFKVKYVSEL